MVVGAQGVAMRQQHALGVELGHDRIGEETGARAVTEIAADQEVPVAVHDEAGNSAAGQCAQARTHLLLARIRIVIADPGFEQVAEDIERLRPGRLRAQESQELIDRGGRAGVEVHVGDKQPCHVRRDALIWAKE